ncbi:hypothetical protein BH11BAC3_BH11BAC3_47440 [soil metagenome]
MDSTVSTVQYSGSGVYTVVNKYQYNGNRIINSLTNYTQGPPAIYYETDTIYANYVNGNIVSQIDTTVYFSKQDFKYSYDTHPNPFHRTQYKIALDNRFPYYSMETFVEEIFGKNNALEIDQVMGTYKYHYKNFYEYKSNGLPKIVRFYDQNDPGEFGKGVYFYTK